MVLTRILVSNWYSKLTGVFHPHTASCEAWWFSDAVLYKKKDPPYLTSLFCRHEQKTKKRSVCCMCEIIRQPSIRTNKESYSRALSVLTSFPISILSFT